MFGRRNQHDEGVRRHEEFLRIQEQREEESRQEFRRRDEEFHEFMREMALRHEKVYGPMIVEMEESRKQLRANTEAMLRRLDRFDEPGGATA